jgi:hypothetical protein
LSQFFASKPNLSLAMESNSKIRYPIQRIGLITSF